MKERLRFSIRKASKESGLDHAENCGVGSNSESDRENGNECKAGIAQKHARTISKVLKKVGHKHDKSNLCATNGTAVIIVAKELG